MRYTTLLILAILINSCQGENKNNSEESTGNVMEIEPSQSELDEIAIAKQPIVIQDFFSITPEIFGDAFCYDRSSVSQFILFDNSEDNDWTNFELQDHYISLYHADCDVLLEFMTFHLNGQKKAFLSQMNGGMQQFDYLSWSDKQEHWVSSENYPKPNLEEYFEGLSPSETDLVNEYGVDFVFLNPQSSSATFVFSESGMKLNLGEKEIHQFDQDASYDYVLTSEDDILSLAPIQINTHKKSKQFFVAYSTTAQPTAAFLSKYEAIYNAMDETDLNHQLIHYGSNDFKVMFPKDTFDFSVMEQFEPRDGFWFYTYGDTPLDLGAEENLEVIIQQAKSYFIGIQ